MTSNDSLARLAAVIESRKPANGGDPERSYVARLLHKGPDAFLKKIGEEATEVVMAAKDSTTAATGQARRRSGRPVVPFMIALAHYGLTPADVIARTGAARRHQRHRGKGAAQGAGSVKGAGE